MSKKLYLLLLLGYSAISLSCTKKALPSSSNFEMKMTDYFLNVLDFGAVGDGVTDDTPAFAAAAKLKKPIFIPATDKGFVITKPLSFYADVRGEHMAHSKIIYKGKGWAITMYGGSNFGVTLENLSLHSSREKTNKNVNQSGIRIWGATHNRIQSVRTFGFDGVHIQLGNQDKQSGSYWGRFSEIFCILWPGQKGKTGLHITGQENLIKGNEGIESVNSNANIFQNVVISGGFGTMFYVGGNNNKFIGGTAQWDKQGGNIDHIYYVNGSGNWIHSPYIESADGTLPKNLIYLGPKSKNNRFEQMHNQFNISSNYDVFIVDEGRGNSIDIPSNLYGVSDVIDVSQNLIENSDFKLIRDRLPYGWTKRGNIHAEERISREDVEDGVFRMSLDNDYGELTYALIKGAKSISQYDANFYAGKTISFSVGAKSNIKHCGQLRVYCQNSNGNTTDLGKTRHSGSGEWETLNVVAKIPEDVNQILVSIMSSIRKSDKISGDILFTKPIVSLAGQPKNNNFRYITESGGNIYGDLNMLSGDIIRSDENGNRYRLVPPEGEGVARWEKINN